MIEDNSKKIKETISASESNFNLKSIYNNPNCIIENFSLRDYEIIDFLITRSAKTISSYYFTNENGEPVTPANISEKIEYLNEEDNLDIVNKKIPIVDIDSIDKVNFEKIYDYIHPLQL